MAEIYDLSDQVSVLRDGTYVGTLERDDLSAEALVQMMVGRDLSGFYKKEHAPYDPGHVTMAVRNMADGSRVKNCSFDLHSGEVLGIAGLVGAGRTELARLIFGADPRISGTVEVEGAPVTIRTARRDQCRHHLSHRRPQGQGPVPRCKRARQHQPVRRQHGCQARWPARPPTRQAARRSRDQEPRDPGAQLEGQRALCRAAISRRSCSRACWKSIRGC